LSKRNVAAEAKRRFQNVVFERFSGQRPDLENGLTLKSGVEWQKLGRSNFEIWGPML
jgi:hypothetical protein